MIRNEHAILMGRMVCLLSAYRLAWNVINKQSKFVERNDFGLLAIFSFFVRSPRMSVIVFVMPKMSTYFIALLGGSTEQREKFDTIRFFFFSI